jgi:hypothetical protein
LTKGKSAERINGYSIPVQVSNGNQALIRKLRKPILKKYTNENMSIMDINWIVRLIEESRYRTFQKVNEKMALLCFTLGKTFSVRVDEGARGDKKVEEISAFIINRFPGLIGYIHLGIYRLKPFYRTYSSDY